MPLGRLPFGAVVICHPGAVSFCRPIRPARIRSVLIAYLYQYRRISGGDGCGSILLFPWFNPGPMRSCNSPLSCFCLLRQAFPQPINAAPVRARHARSACQRSIFDMLVDEGMSLLPGAASRIFNLSRGSFAVGKTANSCGFCASCHPFPILFVSFCGTIENYKETTLPLENRISRRKNRLAPAHTPSGTAKTRKGFRPLALSRVF